MEEIRDAGYDPYVLDFQQVQTSLCTDLFLSTNYIHWYHLRSYDRINAPYESFIKQMEEKSGISFDKARVALARKWIGKIDESLVQDKGLRNLPLLL